MSDLSRTKERRYDWPHTPTWPRKTPPLTPPDSCRRIPVHEHLPWVTCPPPIGEVTFAPATVEYLALAARDRASPPSLSTLLSITHQEEASFLLPGVHPYPLLSTLSTRPEKSHDAKSTFEQVKAIRASLPRPTSSMSAIWPCWTSPRNGTRRAIAPRPAQ